MKARSGPPTGYTHLQTHVSLLKALTANTVGGSRPQLDPTANSLTKTATRHDFSRIFLSSPVSLGVYVCVYILVYDTQNIHFTCKARTFFGEGRTCWLVLTASSILRKVETTKSSHSPGVRSPLGMN